MKILMKVERPEDVRITLATTMTVGQWQKLVESMTVAMRHEGWNYDVMHFRDAIADALDNIKRTVAGEPTPLTNE